MPGLTHPRTAASTVLAPDPGVFGEARPLRIALAGCGAVGGALIDLLAVQADQWSIDCGLVRDPDRPRPPAVAALTLTADLRRFAALPTDVLVEALGGIEPARTLAVAALERGASVVTVNKALVATHGPELQALADRRGGVLLFDAAVGGGIPAVRTLRSAFGGVPVLGLRGILNGTANFLLTRMEDGADYPTALREAQAAGYAEADPARDVDGRDFADKIRILAWQLWGVEPTDLEVDVSGILPDPDERVRTAAERGRRVRLVAEARLDCASPAGPARRTPGHTVRGTRRVRARVAAMEVSAESVEGRTTGVDNVLTIETETCGSYSLTGPGAGGPATASAMLADLIQVAHRLRAEAAQDSRAGPRRRG